MLRDVAEGIAEFIRRDPVLTRAGNVTVLVEDKAVVQFELANALGQLGVCVLVSVLGFDRRDGVPVCQGNLQLQISCFENPEINRGGTTQMTVQFASERIAKILHYTKFPFLIGQMIFKNFSRDDVDQANIMRGNYEVNTALGYEDRFFHPAPTETQNTERP